MLLAVFKLNIYVVAPFFATVFYNGIPLVVFCKTVPIISAINCGTLSSPYNGQAYKRGSGKGSYYDFQCLTGFVLDGSSKRYCQKNGKWSGTQPRCIRK